jgi:hypothetical protein
MAESTEQGLSDQYARASPWPIPLVLGLVVAELGIVFEGLLPVAVGGLLVLAASIVGISRESGFAATLWKPTLVVAVAFATVGAALYVAVDATARGSAMLGTAVVVVAAAVAAYLYETERL